MRTYDDRIANAFDLLYAGNRRRFDMGFRQSLTAKVANAKLWLIRSAKLNKLYHEWKAIRDRNVCQSGVIFTAHRKPRCAGTGYFPALPDTVTLDAATIDMQLDKPGMLSGDSRSPCRFSRKQNIMRDYDDRIQNAFTLLYTGTWRRFQALQKRGGKENREQASASLRWHNRRERIVNLYEAWKVIRERNVCPPGAWLTAIRKPTCGGVDCFTTFPDRWIEASAIDT